MAGRAGGAGALRRIDLLGALSLVSDLGMGQPMEHALQQTLVAVRLAEALGLEQAEREVVCGNSLMAWIGCHVDSYEQAKWFGDESALKAEFRLSDPTSSGDDVRFLLRHLGGGRPGLGRVGAAIGFARDGGFRHTDEMLETHWRAADSMAERLGLSDGVRRALAHTFERWDGRGDPDGLRGEAIALPARLVSLADVMVVYHRAGGPEAARRVAVARSGTQFDPELAELFCDLAVEVLEELQHTVSWEAIAEAGPMLGATLSDEEADAALEAMADFADVKSPYTLGHSSGVAELAAAAAVDLGLPGDDVRTLRRAALVHDLGRVGVPNEIWDKEAPLSHAEHERVRLHPYLTSRSLAIAPALAELGELAEQHHERLDGSGYPRGTVSGAQTVGGRVLAVADLYRAKLEPRPHRAAVGASDAAAIVRAEVRAGRLDGDAAEAVLRAAGHRPRRRATNVAGLTPREIEVLRLLARGHSTKQIAHELGMARKTAANHVEHIYTKIGVSNRALASLFASRHGLLEGDPAELG